MGLAAGVSRFEFKARVAPYSLRRLFQWPVSLFFSLDGVITADHMGVKEVCSEAFMVFHQERSVVMCTPWGIS